MHKMYFHILSRCAKSVVTRIPAYQSTSYRVISSSSGVTINGMKLQHYLEPPNRLICPSSRKRLLQSDAQSEVQRGCRLRSNDVNTNHPKESAHPQSFLHRLQQAPPPALYLGFAGLIPFAGPALFCLGSLSYSPLLAFTQVTYGATILSFLGGIHWGYSIDNNVSPPSWRNLGYSVIPPLIAWGGLLLTPEFGTLLLMAGFMIAWRWDMKVKTMPPWFKSLRVCLSVGAIVSLAVTYTMGLFFPPPEVSTTNNWLKLAKIIKIILED